MMLKVYNNRIQGTNTLTTLHILSLNNEFIIKHNTLLKIILDADKSLENLRALKSLVLIILVDSDNSQGHASTNKTYSCIKRCTKGMHKDIDKVIKNCHMCRQHNLQKQLHSYQTTQNNVWLKRIRFRRTLPYHFQINTYVLTCICLLTNYHIAISNPDKTAKKLFKATYKTFMLPLVDLPP